MTRTKIDQILQRYVALLPADKYYLLLNELVALQSPAPDREALESILNLIYTHDNETLSRHFARERLLAWAAGQETKREWCHHLVWDKSIGAYLLRPDNVSLVAISHWDQCPVQGCHAPRPNPA